MAKKISASFLITFSFVASLTGCSRETISEVEVRAPSISIYGYKDFSRVIAGTSTYSPITATNPSKQDIIISFVTTDLNSGGLIGVGVLADWSLTSSDNKCAVSGPISKLIGGVYLAVYEGKVRARGNCTYHVNFFPKVASSLSTATLTYNGLNKNFSGTSIANGYYTGSITALSESGGANMYDIGTVSTGTKVSFTLHLTNSGDIDATFPVISSNLKTLNIISTTCDVIVPKQTSCIVNMSTTLSEKSDILNTPINIEYGGSVLKLSLIGSVKALNTYGSFGFSTAPKTLVSTAGTVTFTSDLVQDVYGNIISDGVPATVSFYGGFTHDGTKDPFVIYSTGGRFSFSLTTDGSIGSSSISLNTLTSTGLATVIIQ